MHPGMLWEKRWCHVTELRKFFAFVPGTPTVSMQNLLQLSQRLLLPQAGLVGGKLLSADFQCVGSGPHVDEAGHYAVPPEKEQWVLQSFSDLCFA